jgi:toxin FitB
MIVLDSNIIIYSEQLEFAYLKSVVFAPGTFIASVSRIEVLGFTRLTQAQRSYFDGTLRMIPQITLDETIIQKAILLRQSHKLSLGDSIVAATALVHAATLYTRNVADFQRIAGLVVINPMA